MIAASSLCKREVIELVRCGPRPENPELYITIRNYLELFTRVLDLTQTSQYGRAFTTSG